MRVLFLHPNFPAQFRHLAIRLAQNSANQVIFGTACSTGQLPGVHKALYQIARPPHPQTHPYIRSTEKAVLEGQAVYRMGQRMRDQGFVPDVIYAHSGWGPGLFVKDLFPQAKYCAYFEWFYHAHGSDADFDPTDSVNLDDEARLRIKNAPILLDLASCDQGLSPTAWQRQQFPAEFQAKIETLHDGIDTTFFRPQARAKLVLPSIGLDLSQAKEIVTYVARGMEPYRGFPQFMAAVALILKRRPHCHVVVVGEDRVAYGKPLPSGQTYKQHMLERLSLDRSRLHFTGRLPYDQYLRVLQASSAHVYLTRPFVLSWSMLEAMSAGCLVVASHTAPVTEIIQDGENGLLVDFFSPQEIAQRVEEVLENHDLMTGLRANARATIVQKYNLRTLLSQHIQWLAAGLDLNSQSSSKFKGFGIRPTLLSKETIRRKSRAKRKDNPSPFPMVIRSTVPSRATCSTS